MKAGNWRNVRDVPILVERHKHRIVKREGVWRMYCPDLGPNMLIYAWHWSWVLAACETKCPHVDQLSTDVPV